MADKKEAEDLELGEAGKGGKKKLIIIIAAAVLLIGGGVGGFLMMKGGDDKKAKPAAEHSEAAADEEHASDEEAASEEEAHGEEEPAEEGHGEEAAAEEGHGEEEAPAEEGAEGAHAGPLYVVMEEPILTNVSGETKTRMLKMQVAFLVKNAAAEGKVKKHLPLLKSEFLLLISGYTAEQLLSQEGQQGFRDKALEKMRSVIEHEEKKPYIEKLLFTQFVMQ